MIGLWRSQRMEIVIHLRPHVYLHIVNKFQSRGFDFLNRRSSNPLPDSYCQRQKLYHTAMPPGPFTCGKYDLFPVSVWGEFLQRWEMFLPWHLW